MKGHLIISTSNELLCVAGAQIIYIQADGNYSNMLISGGYIRQVTLQLHQVEEMIHKQLPDMRSHFIRVGKSVIININYLHFINIPRQQLLLKDGVYVQSQSASKEALKLLKEHIDRIR